MRDSSDPAARVRHARIELPDREYQRLKRAARAIGLPVAAYIRMAVLERIAEDERKAGAVRDHLVRAVPIGAGPGGMWD